MQKSSVARVVPSLIALPLLFGAGFGALELLRAQRFPWPEGYWQDPLRQQMLLTLTVAGILVFAIAEIIRRCPAPEEFDEYLGED